MLIINNRRSIRKYSNKDVNKEDIIKILRASMQAPSARNQKPWEFLVVKNKEKLVKCSEELPNTKMLKEANFAIVYMTDKRDLTTPLMYPQDLSAAILNGLLEATHLNIGSCWCGIYPNEERMQKVREIFGINKDYLEPFAVVSFGYPLDDEDFKFIDRFDESKIHFEVL